MKKLIGFSIILLLQLPCPRSIAQKPADVFAYYRDTVPNQHLYVQFDKQAYVAGDTMWLKAYVYSSYAPSSLSTNFYIDLVDDKGNMIQSKRYPVFDGTAIGNFDLPANLRQGVYVARAYTRWTTAFDQSFVFKKAIPVFNPSSTQAVRSTPEFSFDLFPEGGRLIADLPNNIVFRARNQWFQTVPVNAELVDGQGKSIGSFAAQQAEGGFSLTPGFKEKYFAVVTFPDKTIKKIALPDAVYGGATLTVADEENGKSFSALTSPGLVKTGESLQLIAVIDNHVVLDTKVPVNNNEALGLIATKNLQPGVMHIFLFDSQNKMLTHRATLVQNQKLSLPVELRVDEFGRTPKAKTVFSFLLPETSSGSFSVSVTDADKELPATSSGNIYSTILMQSGSVQNLLRTNPANEDEADVLTISTKWYTDNWQALTKKTRPLYLPDKYISLTGTTTTEDGSATVIDGRMDLTVQPKNFIQKNYSVTIGNNGKFHLDSLIYEDSARIYYELITAGKNKKRPPVRLTLDEPTLDFSNILNGIDYSFSKTKEPVFEDTRAIQLAAELQKNLTVAQASTPSAKATKKDKQSDKKEVDKRYAGGLFGSSTARTLDFINDPPAHGGVNVFEALQGRIAGLIIERVNTGYNLWSSRPVSTNEVLRGNKRGLVPGRVFLNEVETSSDVVMRIPIDQIALVKFYEPGSIMLPGVGASPILAFWTKRIEDMGEENKNNLNHVVQDGYSPTRKFYSPDYSGTSKNVADNRTTLYWDPNISVTDEKQFTINFYNSDSVKRFHVVVEGFTANGKLVHLDKIVDMPKAF